MSTAARENDIRTILEGMRTVAVVGLSARPERPSHGVASYLLQNGIRVIPVNPVESEVLGERCYPDLASIPSEVRVDVVDVFRSGEHVPAIVEQALARGVGAVWLQLGVHNPDAAARARSAGVLVVEDRCIKVEHAAHTS